MGARLPGMRATAGVYDTPANAVRVISRIGYNGDQKGPTRAMTTKTDPLDILDRMIKETENRGRVLSSPVLGGPNAAPFDGEELGKFIRLTILREVRERMVVEDA